MNLPFLIGILPQPSIPCVSPLLLVSLSFQSTRDAAQLLESEWSRLIAKNSDRRRQQSLGHHFLLNSEGVFATTGMLKVARFATDSR